MKPSTSMHSNRVLVFDVGGEYGHFRKFNTTTSPLTYSVPPRTSIIGMIGAILGIERELGVGRYKEGQTPLADLLSPEHAKIAVQVLNPVNKVSMAFNLLNTKNSFFNIDNRTQIEFEFLKNPKFRIFLTWDNVKLFNDLTERISERKNNFTVCLGLSQLLASVSIIGVFQSKLLPETSTYTPVISAVKMNLLDSSNPIQLTENRQFRYTSDTHPIYMTSDRLVKDFAEILIESNGNPLWVKSQHIVEIESLGNILFL